MLISRIIRFLERFNIFEHTKSSDINSTAVLQGVRTKGEIHIGEESQVLNTQIKGLVSIGMNNEISGCDLNGSIKTGKNVRLLNGVRLNGNVVIGNYTSISGPNTDLSSLLNQVKIGSFCSIARNVTFQEYNHDISRMTSYFVYRNLKSGDVRNDVISKGNIELGHDVWIGTHSVILSGVEMGTGAVVAANSVVTRDVPPYAIVAGSPAKIIKYRFPESVIAQLLESRWWSLTKTEIIEKFEEFNSQIS